MARPITDLFHIELPIIQAPMAGVQGSALAIAVSQAGGLGSLPAAMLSVDALREAIAEIRRGTDRPFNVNFFCHAAPIFDAGRDAAWRETLAPYYDELDVSRDATSAGPARASFSAEFAELIEELRPPVVSFHFGLPDEALLERVRRSGAKILSSATTVEEARWLEARGVDAVIAQGVEAGGHRGMFLSDDVTTQLGTFALLPQIVDAVRVPVIAAGGIADARGVAAAMRLGAAGVQIGTAYLLCAEATTSKVHRAALRSEAARHTALTNVITGRPARGIVNRIVRELGPMRDSVPAFPLATAAVTPLRAAAEARGSGDFSPLWAGQNASQCRDVTAAELTRLLARTRDERLLDELRQYAPSDDVEAAHRRAMLDLLERGDTAFTRGHFAPGHFTASCYIVDDAGRLLLHHHRRLDRWLQMGGHIEVDESPAVAALREGREECGLDDLVLVGDGIFDLDIHPIPAAKGEPDHHHFDVRYLARTASPDAVIADRAESNELAWFSLARAAELMPGPEFVRVLRKLRGSNREIVHRVFDALSKGDSRPLLDLLAEDVTWRVMGQTPWSRTYAGKASVINDLLRPLGSRLAERYRATAKRIVAEGESVVVEAIGQAITKSGVPYNNEYCFVYRLDDGRIKEVTEYLDTELVVAALGE